MTKTQAIREARKAHGPLYKLGNQWVFTRKSGGDYRESTPRDHQSARDARARSIAEDALILMGADIADAMDYARNFERADVDAIIAGYSAHSRRLSVQHPPL